MARKSTFPHPNCRTTGRSEEHTSELQFVISYAVFCLKKKEWGYDVGAGLSDPVIGEVRRFLSDWTRGIGAEFFLGSLPAGLCLSGPHPRGPLLSNSVVSR